MDQRAFQTIKVGDQAFELDVMIYGGERVSKRPLLILHSIEFAMPPSEAFCEMMWSVDLQVIFVRRPGYGESSPMPAALMTKATITSGATAMAEAAMVRALIEKLTLKDITLLAVGSANPICYRLVHMTQDLSRVIFVNPVFNQDIMQVFHPDWLREMLKQVISSKGGLRVAEAGMKLLIRNDPIAYYHTILRNSSGDVDYVNSHVRDYEHAARLALETESDMLYYDAIMCLTPDALLKDGFFEGVDAAILIGADSTPYWQNEMQNEADRLGLPLYEASAGDKFCAYASPQDVLAILDETRPVEAAPAE